MLDLVVAWNPLQLAADWLFDGNDLATTDTLQTAVLVSLLTDRLANTDDAIPDGSGDRRGWWGDLAVPLADGPPAGDLIGSRLWLLLRRKVDEQTRIDAITYCREALQWLIDDAIAGAIDVQAVWNSATLGRLDITIAISRTNADTGATASASYRLAWSTTLGIPLDWS
jgi:phage gp46-like protein